MAALQSGKHRGVERFKTRIGILHGRRETHPDIDWPLGSGISNRSGLGTSALRSALLLTLLNFELVISVRSAFAAGTTANTGTIGLTRQSSTPQTNDDIAYGTKKSFCITFPAGTSTTNLQTVGYPPDVLKTVKGGACSLDGLNGFWVETTASLNSLCTFGTADILVQNPVTFKSLAKKRLKILRPTHTISVIRPDENNGIYRCSALPPRFVRSAVAARKERPGGGVLWNVTIHGELDSNGNEPVFDGLNLDEIVGVKTDECYAGQIGRGSGIIEPGNIWPDFVGLCKDKAVSTKLPWIFGCQTTVTQRFKLGQCEFPGASVSSPQESVTQTHVFQFPRRYHNSRSDGPASSTVSSPAIPYSEQ